MFHCGNKPDTLRGDVADESGDRLLADLPVSSARHGNRPVKPENAAAGRRVELGERLNGRSVTSVRDRQTQPMEMSTT
jgi:hypothetical protein